MYTTDVAQGKLSRSFYLNSGQKLTGNDRYSNYAANISSKKDKIAYNAYHQNDKCSETDIRPKSTKSNQCLITLTDKKRSRANQLVNEGYNFKKEHSLNILDRKATSLGIVLFFA